MHSTKLTSKFQTTVPQEIRTHLGVGAGSEVSWHVVKQFVIMDRHEKIANPAEYLTSQAKTGLKWDAVKAVRQIRESIQ